MGSSTSNINNDKDKPVTQPLTQVEIDRIKEAYKVNKAAMEEREKISIQSKMKYDRMRLEFEAQREERETTRRLQVEKNQVEAKKRIADNKIRDKRKERERKEAEEAKIQYKVLPLMFGFALLMPKNGGRWKIRLKTKN